MNSNFAQISLVPFYPMLIIYFYFLLLAVSAHSMAAQCTEGFMDYDLLQVKASQIGSPVVSIPNSGSQAGTNSTVIYSVNENIGLYPQPDSNGGYVLVYPNLKFTCSGTITGLILVTEFRLRGNGDQYPTIGIFNVVDSDTYTLVPGTERVIVIGPEDFSTSGLYNYTFSSPVQFTNGSVIGIHVFESSKTSVLLLSQYTDVVDSSVVSYIVARRFTNQAPAEYIRVLTVVGAMLDHRLLLHPLVSSSEGMMQ